MRILGYVYFIDFASWNLFVSARSALFGTATFMNFCRIHHASLIFNSWKRKEYDIVRKTQMRHSSMLCFRKKIRYIMPRKRKKGERWKESPEIYPSSWFNLVWGTTYFLQRSYLAPHFELSPFFFKWIRSKLLYSDLGDFLTVSKAFGCSVGKPGIKEWSLCVSYSGIAQLVRLLDYNWHFCFWSAGPSRWRIFQVTQFCTANVKRKRL